MAKKKAKKASTHKKKRMSGVPIDFKALAMAGAAAAGATYLINGPMKTTGWVNYAAIGAGLLLAWKMPKVAAAGYGLVAAGTVSALQNAGVISGVGGPGRVIIHGGPPGSGPMSSIAGGRRRMSGNMNPKQINSFNTRQQQAGQRRVIIGQANAPISSIASDYDPCDM